MRSKCLLLVKIQIQNLGLKKKWGVKQIFLAAIDVYKRQEAVMPTSQNVSEKERPFFRRGLLVRQS